MRAADTNVLVRLLVRDDDAQVAAAERFLGRGVWISHVVLAETVWTLRSVYAFDAARIVTSVEGLLENDAVALQQPEVVRDALAGFRRSPRIDFSDYLILETARRAGHLPLGTFDRDLAKLDGAERL